MCFNRGDIVLCDFGNDYSNSVQAGKRPAVIVCNSACIENSSILTVLPLTSSVNKQRPFHLFLNYDYYGFLKKDSIVLTEQIQTVSVSKIFEVLGTLSYKDRRLLEDKLRYCLDL